MRFKGHSHRMLPSQKDMSSTIGNKLRIKKVSATMCQESGFV